MPNYPRELNLDKDTEERLRSFLNIELLNHYMERQPFQDDLKYWQTDYWAKPSTTRQKFPFDGAANLIVPVTAITVEAAFANHMTTLFALDQFLAAKPASREWSDHAHPVENALNKEMLHNMRIREKIRDPVLECLKFGTGIGKVQYERIKKRAVRENPDGTESEIEVITKDGPTFDGCSNGRFLMPYSDLDPQMAEWVGEEHAATPYQIKIMEQSGLFRPGTFEAIKAWVVRSAIGTYGVERRFQRTQEELEHRPAQWPKFIDWNELWLGFDINGDGEDEEIVVHYHRAAQHFMSVRYNWYQDLHRPYRLCVYIPVEFRWAGLGLCKQNQEFQKEITTIHRQRIDNATLANMRMIKVTRASGISKGEPIFPGKIWILDDLTHLDTVQMGEVYPSSFSNEQAVLQYAQQRSGINDVSLGTPQVGTPGTATSDLARIQEGNKKKDYVYGNIKIFSQDIILDTACVIAQFGPKSALIYGQEDGEFARSYFQQPVEQIRGQYLLELRPVGQTLNKIVDRQNWQQVAQMLNLYYQQMFQLLQQVQQPQLMEQFVQDALYGSTEAVKQILETFDIRNIDRIIPTELLRVLTSLASSSNNGSQPGQTNPAGLLGAGPSGAGTPGPAFAARGISDVVGGGAPPTGPGLSPAPGLLSAGAGV